MLRLTTRRYHQTTAIGTASANAYPATLVTIQQCLATLVTIAGIVVNLFFTSRTNYHIFTLPFYFFTFLPLLYIFW